ncbi:hypothetical protein C7271_10830 [filamentous cyanobacterium CCP5]|nr:hypothetical protein C7271_10830 [filamentous cyanobacterium CCP5]
MPRLCDRAYQILATEVHRLCPNPAEQVRVDIVLKRLNRFRQAEGPALSIEEMREAVIDIFPNFSEPVLKQAAKANKQGKAVKGTIWGLGCLGIALASLTTLAGGIWVLNLPYPMIRWPVARTVPLVLLPSYIRMDHNYRQAIALVEQADQLVNRATSPQDIDLGADKTEQAQDHLDQLPVWFLGYYPRGYCSFFSCAWRFTYDEFQNARKLIGRNEAIIFQEENALTLLATATAEVEAAKAAYQSAESDQQQAQAVARWQVGMDQLNEIPNETLAGRMANTKLAAYERDFAQVSGMLSGGGRTSDRVTVAQAFAAQAAQTAANPPHSVIVWQNVAELWQEAIQRLESVPLEDPGYVTAQTLLAQYTANLGQIEIRIAAETASVKALNVAKDSSVQLVQQSDRVSAQQTSAQLQSVINALEQVEPGTTAYDEAQVLLQQAEDKLKQLNP